MLDLVKNYMQKHAMVKPGDLVILGVSGGPDSMALLYIMKQLASQGNFLIAAAHLNHCLREEADQEEHFVKSYCQQWQVPFYSRKAKITEVAAQRRQSLEEAGRDERYRFFRELQAELGAASIATAHHEDDAAETVMHHLIRGSGLKGLRGILPVSQGIIRPLLCANRCQIERFLDDNSIKYCTDLSNFESVYMRNRIRHELIPFLKKEFNPRIVEALNQLAEIVREENAAIEMETERMWAGLAAEKPSGVAMDVAKLNDLPRAYQRRLVLKALSLVADEGGWRLKDVDYVLSLLNKPGSDKRLQLSRGVAVAKVYDKLEFSQERWEVAAFCYKVDIPGKMYIAEINFGIITDIIKKNAFNPEPGDIYLDYDRLHLPLFIRSRRIGDRFKPAGFEGSKKIKDYFIDLKIPARERDYIPLLASQEEIYAVIGYRVASAAMVTKETQNILVIKRYDYGKE